MIVLVLYLTKIEIISKENFVFIKMLKKNKTFKNILFNDLYWYICPSNSGCSVARLSRLVWDQEVAGSNPATPTNESFLL